MHNLSFVYILILKLINYYMLMFEFYNQIFIIKL